MGDFCNLTVECLEKKIRETRSFGGVDIGSSSPCRWWNCGSTSTPRMAHGGRCLGSRPHGGGGESRRSSLDLLRRQLHVRELRQAGMGDTGDAQDPHHQSSRAGRRTRRSTPNHVNPTMAKLAICYPELAGLRPHDLGYHRLAGDVVRSEHQGCAADARPQEHLDDAGPVPRSRRIGGSPRPPRPESTAGGLI
jgi:hypothetical protein